MLRDDFERNDFELLAPVLVVYSTGSGCGGERGAGRVNFFGEIQISGESPTTVSHMRE
jgi:hypothetical protein